jgi:hypothetical protein
LPLLRFQAAGVWVRHVDVHQVSQVEAQVWDAPAGIDFVKTAVAKNRGAIFFTKR